MNLARRNLLKFAGGAAAGVALTPMPWKLLGDSAIWSQNWSWIPRLPSGPGSVKYTACTLCPAGCGVEAHCVGEQPVSLKGVASNPVSQGTLCALGIAAHHLPYHPRRASRPLLASTDGTHHPVTLDSAVQEISRAIRNRHPGQAVAILDERPGRTLSYIYRKYLGGIEGGLYLTPPERETATFAAVSHLTSTPRCGLDLSSTASILSFGAPLLDGWGVPAQVNAARYCKTKPIKIIQVETRQSRTASLADLWLAIRPGAETAVALAIAHTLITEKLVPSTNLDRASDATAYRELIASFTPDSVSSLAGVPAETLIIAARMLAANAPAVAIGGGDPGGDPGSQTEEIAIAGLNLLLGSAGVTGGFIAREEPPVPAGWTADHLAPVQSLNDVPDASIAVLFLGDAPSGDALPWSSIQRKLAPGRGYVVSLAPFVEGGARRAQLIVPAPAFLENIEEVPTPPVAVAPSLAIAPQLLKAPAGAVDTCQLWSKLGCEVDLTARLKERVAAIHAARRGNVHDANGTKPVADFTQPDDLWKAMNDGAIWTGEAAPGKPPAHYSLLAGLDPGRIRAYAKQTHQPSPDFPLTVMPYAWRGASGGALPSPLTKVYQESSLRAHSGQCRIHPSTAAQFHVKDGDHVSVETGCGSCNAFLWVDASVMPGVMEMAAGPQAAGTETNVLDVCGVDGECTWRATQARIRRIS